MFRPFRPARRMLTPAQLQSLQHANQLSSSGKPEQAAPLFAGLAQEMDRSRHPRLAASLHAQAAHAYAECRDEAQSLAEARLALDLFLQSRMVGRAPRFYANIIHKLEIRGMKSAAQALQKEYGERVGKLPTPAQAVPARRGRLPTACPQCGAPLHPDELTWANRFTTECPYCGAVIQTEA